MLPELISEGRRVLLFSQFTSMLALIQEELKRLRIPHVILTGDTTDRATPVREFQAGRSPAVASSVRHLVAGVDAWSGSRLVAKVWRSAGSMPSGCVL